MSITIKNGSITLKNLAELGSVLDPQTLPPGPEVADSQPTSGSEVTQEAGAAQTIAPHNLASLLAQLSTISTGLDAMARQDAYARDQAALDLARYEALLVDKQEAERALAEVRRLRAAAEQLSAEAFTDEARAQDDGVADRSPPPGPRPADIDEDLRRDVGSDAAVARLLRLTLTSSAKEENMTLFFCMHQLRRE